MARGVFVVVFMGIVATRARAECFGLAERRHMSSIDQSEMPKKEPTFSWLVTLFLPAMLNFKCLLQPHSNIPPPVLAILVGRLPTAVTPPIQDGAIEATNEEEGRCRRVAALTES